MSDFGTTFLHAYADRIGEYDDPVGCPDRTSTEWADAAIVNGKPWKQRYAEARAGTGCICGQRHDTDQQEAREHDHQEENPGR